MKKLILLITISVFTGCFYSHPNLSTNIGYGAQIINKGSSTRGYGHFEWESRDAIIRKKASTGALSMMGSLEKLAYLKSVPKGGIVSFHCTRSSADYPYRIKIEDLNGEVLKNCNDRSDGFGLDCSQYGCYWDHIFSCYLHEEIEGSIIVKLNDPLMKKIFIIEIIPL